LISFMNEIGEVVVVALTLPKVVKATLSPLILR
jgi:hypothetical protein